MWRSIDPGSAAMCYMGGSEKEKKRFQVRSCGRKRVWDDPWVHVSVA